MTGRMTGEQEKLAKLVARCNENIERFITEFNLNNEFEFFNTAEKVGIKDALKWIEENKERDWFRNNRDDSDLSMVIFWNNARNCYMNRLVALNESEAT